MSKLISLKEAITTYVQDGDTVYAAGFTHLIPFAAGHEIIRQKKQDLVLARATPDLIYDQMVAAGCARKVIFSYMGNPGVGSLRIVRSALENAGLEWEEYSHFGMITRLQAGASGLPFLPMNQTAAEDLERLNPLIKRIPDPLRRQGCDRGAFLQPRRGYRPRPADAGGNAPVGHHRRQKEAPSPPNG
jgi:glutaconate CoA-transferase subunit A